MVDFFYPQDDTGDNSHLQLFCASHYICMIDLCEKEYSFHQQNRSGWKMKSFLALIHTEGLMSVKQIIASKMAQATTSENKAVIMLDHPRNRSNAFDMLIAEPMFEFCNISQCNFCLDNMANVVHFMGDTESEDFFKMNMYKN